MILRSLGNSEKIILFLVVLETKVSPLEAVNDVFIEETRQTTENEQNTENRFREVGKSRRAGKKVVCNRETLDKTLSKFYAEFRK